MKKLFTFLISFLLIFTCTSNVSAYSLIKSDSDAIQGNYKEGEVIVQYDGSSPFTGNSVSSKTSKILDELTVQDTTSLGVSVNSDEKTSVALVSSDTLSTEEMIDVLEDDKNVDAVSPNYIRTVNDVSLSSDSDAIWALDNTGQNGGTSGLDINADSLQSNTRTSNQQVIALIDTGINEDDSYLARHLWTNSYGKKLGNGTHGYNFLYDGDVYTSEEPIDDFGHGSHCAGIMNSVVNGLGDEEADNVQIMALKVFDAEGSGDDYSIIAAYNYIRVAQNLGVNIIAVNNSWGGEGYDEVLDNCVTQVGEKGCISVFAAGNESTNIDEVTYSCDLTSPYSIVVGATNEKGELASFSNYGSTNVDIAAPGCDILSTVNTATFTPSAYTDEEAANVVAQLYNYNEADAATKLADSSFDNLTNGYVVTDSDDVEASIDNDIYFTSNSGSQDQDGSLKVTIHGTAGNTYKFALPYAGGTNQYMNFMFREDCPTEDNEDSALYLYNGADYSEEPSLFTLLGAFYVNSSSNYWDQLSTPLGLSTSGTTQYMIFYLDCEKDGDYTFYIDDFAFSKDNPTASELGDLAYYNGTSMATPYVTGAVALVSNLKENENLSTLEIIDMIKSSNTYSSDLSGYVGDSGILDLSQISETDSTGTQKYKNNILVDSFTYDQDTKEGYISGLNLEGATVTINDDTTNVYKSYDSATGMITVDVADYANEYVAVHVTKNDRTISIKTYISGASKEYTFDAYIDNDMISSIGTMMSDGQYLYYTDGQIYIVDPTLTYETSPYEPIWDDEEDWSYSKGYSQLADDVEDDWDDSEWDDDYSDTVEAVVSASIDMPDLDVFGDKTNVTGENGMYFSMTAGNSFTILNGVIYTYITVSQLNTVGNPIYGDTFFMSYDTETNMWYLIETSSNDANSPLNENVTNQTVAYYNNQIYLIGGYNEATNEMISGVAIYNPTTGIWKTGTSLPEAEAGGQTVQVGNQLVYSLGYATKDSIQTDTAGNKYLAVPNTYVFDGTTWTKVDETLKSYTYNKVTDTDFYQANGGLGLLDNKVLYTGISCAKYGDTFYLNLADDTYHATAYTNGGLSSGQTFKGTVINNRVYGILTNGQDAYPEVYTYGTVTSGLIKTQSNSAITLSTKTLPGQNATVKITVKNKTKYLASITLVDSNGKTVSGKNVKSLTFKNAAGTIKVKSYKLNTYVTSLKLNIKSKTVKYSKTKTIKLKATVNKLATNKKIKWTTSNKKYATVSSTGKVTIKKAGIGHKVTITATAQDGSKKKATCKITIKK